MRKGITILFVVIILLSGAQFTIATHFCGDKVAATKVSLSGKLASCGMESSDKIFPSSGSYLKSHCCDNKIATIGILNNFTAPVSICTENTQNFLSIYYLPVSQRAHSNSVTNVFYTSISPPGKFTAPSVNLEGICVFRI
jgi:hypothetical protein